MSSSRHLRYKLHVALFGHIGNWLWRSRQARRQARGRAIRRASEAYLRPYVTAACAVPEDQPDRQAPRRVFTMWLQGLGQAPPVVRACLDSIRQYAGAELVVLDGKTVFDWITLPERIVSLWKSGKMRAAHFADICRVELLYRYGGVWMDATCYLDAPLPAWLWEADFFVYQGGETGLGAYGGIQNCFIRAAKGAYLVKVWRESCFRRRWRPIPAPRRCMRRCRPWSRIRPMSCGTIMRTSPLTRPSCTRSAPRPSSRSSIINSLRPRTPFRVPLPTISWPRTDETLVPVRIL